MDPDVDLSQQLDLDVETVQSAVKTLLERRLATDETVGIGEDEPQRYNVTLKSEGFQLAHDRDQAQRNRASNRAVTLLTLVLAFVGMAQATALTAQASEIVTGRLAFVIWIGAFLILLRGCHRTVATPQSRVNVGVSYRDTSSYPMSGPE